MRRSILLAATCVAAGLLTAGCSAETEAETDTQVGNAAVCLSLKGLEATVEGLATGVTGTGDVTVGAAQESINQIQAAYDSVVRNLATLSTDVEDQVLTAQQQFEEAQMQVEAGLSGLDGDQSLSDVPQEEASAISTLASSYQQLSDSLGCES